MATTTNVIKLKRSNEPLLVPSAGDLQFGELGVNTRDGKLYFKRGFDGVGTPPPGVFTSIETIVTTHAQVTGSIELTVAVSSSHMLIDKSTADAPTNSDLFTIRLNGDDVLNVDNKGILSLPPKIGTLAASPDEGSIAMSGSNMWIYI